LAAAGRNRSQNRGDAFEPDEENGRVGLSFLMVNAVPHDGRDVRATSGASLADIEAVYRSSFARLLAVAAMVCGDAEEGREAVQEGFVRAIRRRDSYRGEAPLEAWLWRVVVNTAQSAVQRPRAIPVGDAPEAGHEPAGVDDAMLGALGALPVRQRTVLFLRFYADLDYRTIADILEIGVGTVGSTLNAALAALRRGMAREVAE
jgi:RNA polymerase sigma factor (sigma-70 family)